MQDARKAYQYLSYFYPEGTHPASGGCLVTKDYAHIAAPYFDDRTIRHTLAHELAHDCVAHLPIPLWLDEGHATTVQRLLEDRQRPVLDHEMRDRHVAFWNEENIQEFWAGTSFGQPGDSSELSYSLAEVLVGLLAQTPAPFAGFFRHAHYDDAGQTAALDYLGVSLGEVVAGFLGEGDWRPYRQHLVECWRKQKAGRRP